MEKQRESATDRGGDRERETERDRERQRETARREERHGPGSHAILPLHSSVHAAYLPACLPTRLSARLPACPLACSFILSLTPYLDIILPLTASAHCIAYSASSHTCCRFCPPVSSNSESLALQLKDYIRSHCLSCHPLSPTRLHSTPISCTRSPIPCMSCPLLQQVRLHT